MIESTGLACQKLVCDLVSSRLPKAYGFDPVKDIQVLLPDQSRPHRQCGAEPTLAGDPQPAHARQTADRHREKTQKFCVWVIRSCRSKTTTTSPMSATAPRPG